MLPPLGAAYPNYNSDISGNYEQGAGSKLKAHKTSGGRKTPVLHTIPLGIVIFLV